MHTTSSADGTKLAYDRMGEGPAVVLVGGALNDRRTTAPLAAGLADRFTVYSYDRRGRGDSGDTEPYAVTREIEDLGAVIAAAGGSARVYGMSSGAVLALRAAEAGMPITRLGLFEPPLRTALAPPAPPSYLARLEEALAAGRRADALALFLVEQVGLTEQSAADAIQNPALQAIAHTLRYDHLVHADPDLPPHPCVPTLALAGGESPQWIHDAARGVGGEFRVLSGQTHKVDPAVLAKVLAEYFS